MQRIADCRSHFVHRCRLRRSKIVRALHRCIRQRLADDRHHIVAVNPGNRLRPRPGRPADEQPERCGQPV